MVNGKTIRDIKINPPIGVPLHWVQDWLCHVIKQSPTYLYSHGDYKLSEAEQADFEAGIAKMQAGTPLAYLIGKQAFWDLEFIVNEHTLIPRPDTEVLIEHVMNWINVHHAESSHIKHLLDLGAGSGCIAISLASELERLFPSQWEVMGIDFSAHALDIAKQNAQLNQVDNVDFVQSDWFLNVSRQIKFDVIVSNPPYINEHDIHLINLTEEPRTALTAKDDGLADIYHIVQNAPDYLLESGLLAIEHGYNQSEEVRKSFAQNGFVGVYTIKDYGGNDRLTMGLRPS